MVELLENRGHIGGLYDIPNVKMSENSYCDIKILLFKDDEEISKENLDGKIGDDQQQEGDNKEDPKENKEE